MGEPPILASLGMFIIDDNEYHSSFNKEPERDIVGGGASYAIIGGRIIAGAKQGHRISGIIDKGSDFPETVDDEIRSWNTGVVFRTDNSRLTSRGVNIYDEYEIRHFKMLTPKKRVEFEDVAENEYLLLSKSYHFCCSAVRAEEIIDKLTDAKKQAPISIFEPHPADCIPENRPALETLLAKVDIFTPNFDEACSYLNIAQEDKKNHHVSELAREFAKYLRKPNSGILIRCGSEGCHILTIDGFEVMLPAYHIEQDKVIDVTGGGNSFCGGCVTGFYLSGGDWVTAGVCGNLASGCIIERLGMPVRDDTSDENWNGTNLTHRLQIYTERNKELLRNYNLKLNWL